MGIVIAVFLEMADVSGIEDEIASFGIDVVLIGTYFIITNAEKWTPTILYRSSQEIDVLNLVDLTEGIGRKREVTIILTLGADIIDADISNGRTKTIPSFRQFEGMGIDGIADIIAET